MPFGDFRAVTIPSVGTVTYVTRIVEQRTDEPKLCPVCAEFVVLAGCAFVADYQPGHCQRDVQCVLDIVIDGVAAEIARQLAMEQRVEILECLSQGASPIPEKGKCWLVPPSVARLGKNVPKVRNGLGVSLSLSVPLGTVG